MRFDHLVRPGESGRRAGKLAAEVFMLSGQDLALIKRHDVLWVDGQPFRQIDRVQEGQTISVLLSDPPAPKKALPFVLYEDSYLRVIDKPHGLATMASSNPDGRSLQKLYTGAYGEFRPVNRLDKGTGGLMVCGTTAYTQHALAAQLHTDRFIREYLAVVDGTIHAETGMIDLPIARKSQTGNIRCISPEGQPSLTHYRTLETRNDHSLIRLRLITGRTHQIRVHLMSIGHPVAGDYLYGKALQEFPDSFALHSAYLFLRHPWTGESLFFRSEMPPCYMELIR